MWRSFKGPIIGIIMGIGIAIWGFIDRTAFLPGQGGRQRHEWIKDIFYSAFGEYSGMAFGIIIILFCVGSLVKSILKRP